MGVTQAFEKYLVQIPKTLAQIIQAFFIAVL
jgi:hypothetical protein